MPPASRPSARRFSHSRRRRRRPVLFTHLFAAARAAKARRLLDAARSWQPDAIVWESAISPAPIAATVLGIPAVNHSFGAMCRSRRSSWCRGRRAALGRGRPRAGSLRGSVPGPLPRYLPAELRLGAAARELPCPCDLSARLCSLRLGDRADRPLVYATLGTVLQRARPSSGPCSTGWTPGRDGPHHGQEHRSARARPHSGDVRVEQFVPQAQLLPVCDAVISHGGSGTTLAALAHGLPLVLVPQGADQFDNAARAERAGPRSCCGPEK